MKDKASKNQFQRNGGQSENVVGNNTRSQQIAGGHRRDVKAAKNSLLAKHHQRGAEPPEAAHDVERQHRAEIEADDARHALSENAGVKKKEHQGHDDHEKEKHFVAKRKLNAHAREGGEVFQSRSLLPVSSMNTSSREGVAISRLTSSLP